ncbi:hypothetical protein [Roseateles sp. BYS87W]|uniref:Meckel syndrome type 1 protein n=1 Tax=Pelomonas baiyunensis TaxID=3299026 RepID=A0ABW7H4T3_9BURK
MSALTLHRRNAPDPKLLQRCLLLAGLLHVWLVLVFGNATGTAAPGQGVWGSLTVKLLGRIGSDSNAPPGDPSPALEHNGAPGDGAQTRQGGQVRNEPAPPGPPGAATLGRWNPQPVPAEAATTDELSPQPAEPQPAPPPVPSPPTRTLTAPERSPALQRETVPVPAARPEADAPLPTALPADLPSAVQRLEARSDTPRAALPAPATLRPTPRPSDTFALPPDLTLPAPVARLDATPADRRDLALPRPADLRPAPRAAVTPPPSTELPAAVNRLDAPATPARAAALPKPADLRAAAPAPATPAPTPTDLPAPVQRLEAPSTDTRPVPALPRASANLRAATPAAPVELPSARDLPAPVQRLEAADAGAAAVTRLPAPNAVSPTAAPSAAAAAVPELSRNLPGAVTAPSAAAAPAAAAGPAQGDPQAALRGEVPASGSTASRASAGSPDAGSQLGPDLAVPPSASASAPRAPLNLSLPRGSAIAARRGPGLMELLPQPPERKSKLEQSLENAANPDCRKAYAEAGLLAALPLALDAARGKGCKW